MTWSHKEHFNQGIVVHVIGSGFKNIVLILKVRTKIKLKKIGVSVQGWPGNQSKDRVFPVQTDIHIIGLKSARKTETDRVVSVVKTVTTVDMGVKLIIVFHFKPGSGHVRYFAVFFVHIKQQIHWFYSKIQAQHTPCR